MSPRGEPIWRSVGGWPYARRKKLLPSRLHLSFHLPMPQELGLIVDMIATL